MTQLAVEYSAFIFVAAVGVLQAVFAYSGLKGVCFFCRRWQGYLFAAVATGSAFGWFFLSYDRNRPGLAGLQQVLLFSLASLEALAFTLVVSSILKRRERGTVRGDGLEALREVSYWQALRRGEERDHAPR